jgi:succinoglycan biosynthesis transport protein ExoP
VPIAEEGAQPEIMDYARVLWRAKYVVVAVVVLAVAAALGIDHTRTRLYQGTSSVLFVSQDFASAAVLEPLVPSDIATDMQLIQSSSVRNTASALLGSTAPPPSVSEVGTTNIGEIAVTSPSPSFAARAANAYAHAFAEVSSAQFLNSEQAAEAALQARITSTQRQISATETQLSSTSSVVTSSALSTTVAAMESQLTSLVSQLTQIQVDVAQAPSAARVVGTAVASRTPISPKPITDSIVAGAIGLILAVAFVLLRDFLDDRIRTKEELDRLTKGIPALGLIPAVPNWKKRATPLIVSAARPKSAPAEAYRGLRTSIQFMSLDRPLRKLQVTSPSSAEGKTTTSSNLAVAMAEAGQRVIVMDCDLRRPRLHHFFGRSNGVGLTSLLLGTTRLEDALQPTPMTNLFLLASGPIPPNPSELLGSKRTRQFIDQLAASCDFLVIDSPPVLPVTDATVLAGSTDAVILVVSAGMTTRREVALSLEVLARVDAPIAGVVLNNASEADSYAYYRYGYEAVGPKEPRHTSLEEPPGFVPVGPFPNGQGNGMLGAHVSSEQ